jgi:hypothetical protein
MSASSANKNYFLFNGITDIWPEVLDYVKEDGLPLISSEVGVLLSHIAVIYSCLLIAYAWCETSKNE